MTILLIGGAFQGKYAYACSTFDLKPTDFLPHDQIDNETVWRSCKAVNNLQELLHNPAVDPAKLLPKLLDKVVICNEIGGGIVPIDGDARMWRERVGRMCCELASQADRVERLHMGIAERIK